MRTGIRRRLPDARGPRLVRLVERAGLETRVWLGPWVRRAGAVAGLLWLVAGPVAAGLGLAGTAGVAAWSLRRKPAGLDEALPEVLEGIAAAVRAGASLAQALADLPPTGPLGPAIGAAVLRLRVGATMDEALEAFAQAMGTVQGRLVATALRIGHRSGGDLPRVLETLASAARDRVALAREASASSAQARLSAWVVAAMPPAFLALTTASSPAQARLVFGTLVGWVMLVAGAVLEVVGMLWMRQLARVPV